MRPAAALKESGTSVGIIYSCWLSILDLTTRKTSLPIVKYLVSSMAKIAANMIGIQEWRRSRRRLFGRLIEENMLRRLEKTESSMTGGGRTQSINVDVDVGNLRSLCWGGIGRKLQLDAVLPQNRVPILGVGGALQLQSALPLMPAAIYFTLNFAQRSRLLSLNGFQDLPSNQPAEGPPLPLLPLRFRHLHLSWESCVF